MHPGGAAHRVLGVGGQEYTRNTRNTPPSVIEYCNTIIRHTRIHPSSVERWPGNWLIKPSVEDQPTLAGIDH